MNLISRTYADYKELESAYEKAYAVWEYANTPYLKEMEKNDGGIISGELPGEENIGDYTKIDIPDARENYLRIEKKFNESDSEYNKKAEAVAKQETVGKLNEDTEYTKLKEDFKRKSETYIRVSQADAQLGEKLAQFETDYNQSKKSFDISRDAVKFYNDAVKNLSEEQKEVLRKERDVILSHVAKYGVSTYMNAMAWYSSYRAITGGAGGSHYHANISQYYSYISLHTDIKRDMEILNNSFRNDNTSFDTLVDNYHIYKYYEREADSAWRHYRHTSKARYFTRRERKREAEKLSNKCNNYYSSYYYSGADPIKKTLTDYVRKRNDLNEKTEVLNGISSVKDLSVLKEYIGTGTMYNLSNEDLSHLYDSTSDGFVVTEESINLNSLRKEVKRTDLDGDAVKAVYRNGKVIVLGKDGKELTDAANIYSITNPGISLKLDGESIETFEEGKIYELYDRNFNIKGVTAVMKDLAKQKRDEYYNDLMVYVQKSAAEGKHDYTIMLRDLESTFHGLQQYAVNFNFDQSKAESEKRQRGFDGYAAVTKEYVNNGRGTIDTGPYS
jgi:hypothetical protein